jgi:hypothetical protein
MLEHHPYRRGVLWLVGRHVCLRHLVHILDIVFQNQMQNSVPTTKTHHVLPMKNAILHLFRACQAENLRSRH